MSPRRSRLACAALLGLGAWLSPTLGHTADKFVYLTNWYAQAEHGGFYQAQATGLYQRAGLDVSIKMGGPQINIMQLMMAGQADCVMGYDVQTIQAWEHGIQAVTVAAAFQKDPVILIAHPHIKKLADLKDKTLMIGSAGMVTYWPWLKSRFGFTDAQMRPYNYNIQPFLADKNIAQQGYLASEPYSIEQQGHFKPSVFLLWNEGWPPYATTVVCSTQTIKTKPRQVAAFVKASMEGWKSYLGGNPAPANALIKRDNPNMTDDLLAYGIGKLKEAGVVLGGDAATQGIGTITDARMQATFDMLVKHKLVDPKKVNLKDTYTTRFVKDLKVMP
ncbi:MAG TPA: ABC transporter substrate-binding protein [Aquabacterium sp.]|uniref:ABC transporter substrate-binding protein n=1 Tax=Aquabacterium sp. TaxID=1872578 RepID=UPI002E2F4B54|nr:ABC transporter substrate-binding protein [Aquabacterium sp.]HEX5371388.1 ABC transporter substrate-binding protein [Aquabacterium sp.]